MVTSEGTKQKQLGPTITVIVAAFAAFGRKVTSRPTSTHMSTRRHEDVFIGSVTPCNSKQSAVPRKLEKVTPLLLLRYPGATAATERMPISESDAPTASWESNYPTEWCSQRNAPCE